MRGLVVVVMAQRMRWRDSRGENRRVGMGSLLDGSIIRGRRDGGRNYLPDFVAK